MIGNWCLPSDSGFPLYLQHGGSNLIPLADCASKKANHMRIYQRFVEVATPTAEEQWSGFSIYTNPSPEHKKEAFTNHWKPRATLASQ